MKLRTELIPKNSNFQLNHQGSLLLFGSCFSNNIGSQLEKTKFDCLINPFGISYNPISIHKLILGEIDFQWQCNNEEYFNYSCHSDMNELSLDEAKNNLNIQITKLSDTLNVAPVIIITYGTAWVYEQKSTKKVVNNCHKQPSELFEKRLLSIEEIVNSWALTTKKLSKTYGKNLKVIFTLSPIRHLKEGFHENQLSKSILLLAINRIIVNNSEYQYFPAYELILDDLRDYRFYEDNLTHPNSLAIKYVWEKFSNIFFSNETKQINSEITQLMHGFNHKPFQENSNSHKKFLTELVSKMESFQLKYKIGFEAEIINIQERLIHL